MCIIQYWIGGGLTRDLSDLFLNKMGIKPVHKHPLFHKTKRLFFRVLYNFQPNPSVLVRFNSRLNTYNWGLT